MSQSTATATLPVIAHAAEHSDEPVSTGWTAAHYLGAATGLVLIVLGLAL